MTSFIHVEGKVAIVTGGSRGIGESIAKALGQSGAKVAIASRKKEGLDAAVERLRKEGVTVEAFTCHTGKADDVQKLFQQVIATFGKVDVLVNNAATNPHFGPLMTADDTAFDKTIEVNLKGYFYTSRELVRHLVDRNAPGAIVNVTSVAGLSAAPLQGVYGMTKAAVVSMTQTMAVELAASGIRVNAIAPGLVDTRFAAAIVHNKDLVERVVARTPIGRYGQPDEIAGAALYLASDAASFLTGQTIVVDGGMTIA
ncbi:glucose 1-dehydrogenase [Polyangium jinanense]|uniref:Glucose 1-dehydrogenase n=1 Tax=Polyangium jinanense TaxID=2829994 RepID=A0A9X4AV68_9BACT|nr:glucose 1-dehydrogenase [Polyangium jinanense]MDC3960385.1 glucose 1-dehydrogenase [Polyangium jinanense]MDC3985371.1 glucose 1-dehydrogenase [Polyangium jinanense]